MLLFPGVKYDLNTTNVGRGGDLLLGGDDVVHLLGLDKEKQ